MRKRVSIYIFTILLLGYFDNQVSCFAQNRKIIDSLENLLNQESTHDTIKVMIFDSLGKLYYGNNLEKAIELSTKGIELSKKIGYYYGEAYSLHWVGMYQNFKGSNDKSIIAFLQSLDISERIGDKALAGANLSRIADINRELSNYEKSLRLHDQAVSILRASNHRVYLTNALHRKGLLLRDQKKYEEALSLFQEALVLAKDLKSKNQIALCNYYIGEVYFLQGNYEKAIPFLEECQAISTSINNFIQLSRVNIRLGHIQLSRNNNQKAFLLYQQALVLAQKVNAQPEIKDAYYELYLTHKKLGKTDSALYYFEKNDIIEDSLYSKRKDDLISFYMTQGEIERQKIELDKKQVEINNRNLLIYISILIIIFILIISITLYHNNKKKEKANRLLITQKEEISQQKEQIETQNKDLQLLNEEIVQQKEEIVAFNDHLEDIVEHRTQELKIALDNLTKQNQDLEQFSFIISHNLRAPVARILGLMNILNETDLNNASSQEILGHLQKTTFDLDTVIKDLSQIISIRKNLNKTKEEINLVEAIEQQTFLLKGEIESSNATIEVHDFVEKPLLSIKSYVQSILHNLLSNAIKYKSSKRNPIININIIPLKDTICLSVQDNGIGIDIKNVDAYKIFGLYQRMHDHVEGKGLGLFLVKTQIESLGGKIEVESDLDIGTTFKVYFPL